MIEPDGKYSQMAIEAVIEDKDIDSIQAELIGLRPMTCEKTRYD